MNHSRALPAWIPFAYVAAVSPLAPLATALGPAWVLPILQGSLFYPLFLRLLRARALLRLFTVSVFWALLNSGAVIALTIQEPRLAEQKILHGGVYRTQMFQWIATGSGSEGNVARFLPEHLVHFALFCVACLISFGLLGLCMGAGLLNYMSFYVGSLYLRKNRLGALLLGWPPWAVMRVCGFIAIAIYLVGKMQQHRVRQQLSPVGAHWLWWGMGLILGDVAIKFLVAEVWRNLLLRFAW